MKRINCEHCLSQKIKQSVSYPSDYFCLDCKNGGVLLEETKEEDSYTRSEPALIVIHSDGKKIN